MYLVVSFVALTSDRRMHEQSTGGVAAGRERKLRAMLSFRITGVPAAAFSSLFGLDDAALAERGAKRYTVDAKPGFPDRIEMRDLEPGEHALLVNYVHQPAATPYRASNAIFIREGAEETYDRCDEIPEVLRVRTLSLRAFDTEHMMLDADLTDGTNVERLIERMFADERTAYIHAHYAKRGCFAARIGRNERQ